jgi:glycosyltransferase involved in cell wall biosynthesis
MAEQDSGKQRIASGMPQRGEHPPAPKVLFLVDHLDMGGAERVLTATVPRLAMLGHEVQVGVLDPHPDGVMVASLRARGIHVIRFPFQRLLDPVPLHQLWWHMRAFRADVVHAQLERANTAGLWMAKRQGSATVSTLHTFEDRPRLDRRGRRRRAEEWSLRRHADRILCVSDALRRHCRDLSGLPAERLSVAYNGVDLDEFHAASAISRNESRDALSIPPEAAVLMTVAVLRPPKGLEFMLRAMPAIARACPRVYYVVIGEGPDRPRLEQLAQELRVAAHVLFTGERADVPRLLQAADLFVLPSLTEALPTVLAEAAASGLPIVASHVGGVAEMIEDGRSGYLVAPSSPSELADRCLELLGSAALRRRMGSAGRTVAGERFSLAGQVRRLSSLYHELMAERLGSSCGSR